MELLTDSSVRHSLPTSLMGAARDWYSRLKPNSVDSFGEFADDLVRHFMSSRRSRKTAASLMALRQEDGESLKEFVSRFNREALQVPNLDPSAATNALLAGAKSIEFRRTVARRNPHSLADLMAGAEEYIFIEETLAALDSRRRKIPEEEKNPTKRRDDKPLRKERSSERRERNFTPLNTSRNRILATIRGEDFLKWLNRMLTEGDKRDKSKYCRFHKDHGHGTNECRHLKEEIEPLIQRGYLRKYVEHGGDRRDRQERSPQGRKSPQRPRSPPARRNSPIPCSLRLEPQRSQSTGVINTIMGGPGSRMNLLGRPKSLRSAGQRGPYKPQKIESRERDLFL
ncbi:uncharacterized protein LOC143850365 [Tasmannia lanceolata]|uniref:uncharacterized protein LOC143850365 n=1 Tax=Tasmannia lanceolata TaxID=3420 RepID=UPI004062A0E7